MYWAVLSKCTISKIRSDKPLVLEPPTCSISHHACGRQPTMQRTIYTLPRTNLQAKQSENFLPCLVQACSLLLNTNLLQRTSTSHSEYNCSMLSPYISTTLSHRTLLLLSVQEGRKKGLDRRRRAKMSQRNCEYLDRRRGYHAYVLTMVVH